LTQSDDSLLKNRTAILDGMCKLGVLPSYMTILKNPTGKNWYFYIIPGVLHFHDIPDQIRLADPHKIRCEESPPKY